MTVLTPLNQLLLLNSFGPFYLILFRFHFRPDIHPSHPQSGFLCDFSLTDSYYNNPFPQGDSYCRIALILRLRLTIHDSLLSFFTRSPIDFRVSPQSHSIRITPERHYLHYQVSLSTAPTALPPSYCVPIYVGTPLTTRSLTHGTMLSTVLSTTIYRTPRARYHLKATYPFRILYAISPIATMT